MSSINPGSYSKDKTYKDKRFYLTSFQPISYYSSNPPQTTYRDNNTLRFFNNQSESKENYDDIKDNFNNTMDIFRSKINKTRPSPFYLHEKSLRINDEIDWVKKLIYSKSNLNVNKLIRINPSYLKNVDNIIEKEKEEREKEISEHIINGMRIENLNKIIKINNRLNNRTRNSLLNKRGIDNYNYKNFMYEMTKFKNNGVNKWKTDFRRKFSEY